MQSYHLGLELGGCNDEVAALQSDHYTEVPRMTFQATLPTLKLFVLISACTN